MYPHLGQIVQLYLTPDEINTIESQRELFKLLDVSHLHEGHPIGKDMPVIGIVVRQATSTPTYDLRILLPGTETPYLRNVAASRLMDAAPAPISKSHHDRANELWPHIKEHVKTLLRSFVDIRLTIRD